jgi:hypothetical protein
MTARVAIDERGRCAAEETIQTHEAVATNQRR